MREAEQRLAEEQQSMLGLQVKILPALWSWQWPWSWYRFILFDFQSWSSSRSPGAKFFCSQNLSYPCPCPWSWSLQWSWSWSAGRKLLSSDQNPFWQMMVVGKISHKGHSANCALCASSPGRGWCDVAGRGDGHQWLEHRRRADQHPGGACRPSHGGQVQTKWYLDIINIMLNKNFIINLTPRCPKSPRLLGCHLPLD